MKKPDKRKLRAIDSNTEYDVPAFLARTARQISRGDCGKIRTAVLIVREELTSGECVTRASYIGKGSFEEAVFMLEMAKVKWLK